MSGISRFAKKDMSNFEVLKFVEYIKIFADIEQS